MGLRLFNTAGGRKEDFVPLRPGRVGMYVCGVTVYDFSHLGHARGAYVFDVIRRYLAYRGYDVTYVRNFTDVDDKIIKRANELGIASQELAERFIREYRADMERLGVRPADIEPKATDYIAEIINIVEGLVANGFAYAVEGDVYYRVRRFEGYGKLSHRTFEEMQAGARVEVDERKEDPMDFALWKSSKPGEPSWDSPWGKGRPGWHIECSAMSMKHLGPTFDIHGGGKDLVFPHHENEIAQSEGYSGRQFVRYWLHNGFVNVDQEKMSKSLGNFFTIRDILDKHPAEAVRLFILSTHYRNPIDYSEKNIADAESQLSRFYGYFMKGVMERLSGAATAAAPRREGLGGALAAAVEDLDSVFMEAMDDDFNTALAVGAVNKTKDALAQLLNPGHGLSSGEVRYLLEEFLALVGPQGKISRVLGVFDGTPESWQTAVREIELRNLTSITPEEIEAFIEERKRCRAEKNWARADDIRNELLKRGVALEDGPQGTSWKRQSS